MCVKCGVRDDSLSLQVEAADVVHSDGNSSSCDLLDILLQEQEDSHSGTGSATSGSMGSGSGCNGCGTSSGASGSRTGNGRVTFTKQFTSISYL